MASRRLILHVLLLSLLIAGQWLYLTHTHEHTDHHADRHCQLCLYGLQFNSSLPSSALSLPAVTAKHVASSPIITTAYSFRQHRFQDSRAPPHS